MSFAYLRPKKPRWMWTSLAIAGGSLLLYALLSWLGPWQPGRFWGLTYGSFAAAIFVLDALYPLRRRLLSWPLGTAQRWLQLHIYGGLLAGLFIFIHVGFELPAGRMGWWLLLLSLWVIGTGIFGVLLQKWLPTVITGNLSVEAIYDRIPEMVGRLEKEADALLAGCSEALEQVYMAEIRPRLAAPEPAWSYIVNLRAGRDRRLAPITDMEPFIEEQDRERLADLTTIVNEKLELDLHLSIQRALKYWIYLHLPPAIVLMGLLTVHVFAVVIH